MKSILFSAAFLSLAAVSTAQARTLPPVPTDTIVVRLPNQAVMSLVVRDAQQLRQLPQYHLDSLVARLGGYIKRADDAAKAANTDRITTEFFPNKEQPGQGFPDEIRITTSKTAPGTYGPSNKLEVFVEKKFGVVINTDGQHDTHPRAAATRLERQAQRDSLRQKNIDRNNHQVEFRFDIGLNAFVNKKPYSTAAGLATGNLELRPEGSRYVNLGFDYVQRLGGKGSPVYLSLGPEFAFNNYMLEGNNKWVSVNNRTEVVAETSHQLQKSKLATTTANLPLMLGVRLHDRHGKPTIQLGAGGFVGYLLAQHTKLKYYTDGSTYKDKDHGSYNLNDFQYGLQGTLGFGDLTLFAKYNMNELFKENRGPQTQVLSFGLTISGI